MGSGPLNTAMIQANSAGMPGTQAGFEGIAPYASSSVGSSSSSGFQPVSISGYQPQSEGYFTARGLPQPQQPNPQGQLSTDENGNAIRVLQGGGQIPPSSIVKNDPLNPPYVPPSAPPPGIPPANGGLLQPLGPTPDGRRRPGIYQVQRGI